MCKSEVGCQGLRWPDPYLCAPTAALCTQLLVYGAHTKSKWNCQTTGILQGKILFSALGSSGYEMRRAQEMKITQRSLKNWGVNLTV